MLGNILRHQAEVNQLADHAHPMFMAFITAHAIDFQFVMTIVADTLVISTANHFHHITHPKPLIHTTNGGKGNLRIG